MVIFFQEARIELICCQRHFTGQKIAMNEIRYIGPFITANAKIG